MSIAMLMTIAGALTAISGVAADTEEKVHEGIVLSTSATALVMTDRDGKNEHSHKIDPKAVEITIDGKPAKLLDLTKGDKIKVGVGEDGNVVRVTAIRENKDK